MLQGCAARVESEVYAVVEQTAERGHVEVGEAHEAPGEVGRVVEGAEDAPKLSIEQGLCDASRERNTTLVSHRAEKRLRWVSCHNCSLLTSVLAAPSSR